MLILQTVCVCIMLSAVLFYRLNSTYSLSSRHILGPTTLAAPLVSLKAMCPGGHALESPHLCTAGFVSASTGSKYHINL